MSRCQVVKCTADGKTGTVKAYVAEEFGTEQDAAALAAIIRAGRRAWAASSHPEPLIVPCPRDGCHAGAGAPCTTTGGKPLPGGHRDRHKAAIEADGRTCAAEGAS